MGTNNQSNVVTEFFQKTSSPGPALSLVTEPKAVGGIDVRLWYEPRRLPVLLIKVFDKRADISMVVG